MDGMQQITLDQWMSWKEDIREKLRETAGNFVYIGFRLKQIRDSGMLDGAADIFEFAQNEYGLNKSTTSRFIAINEKFSEGGNSLELRQEYKRIGCSKLAEMLTIPDAECRLITERTTVREIRELKNFTRQQASEEEDEGEERQLSPIEKCLVDYFKDKKDMLNAVIQAIYKGAEKEAAELMNPSGYGTHKKGICFMFMYDYNTGVKAKLLTEPEPVTMAWKDVLAEVYDIFGYLYENGEDDIHRAYYGSQEKVQDEILEEKQEEAAGKEPQKDVSETEKAAESQNEEDSGEDPVAMSQQEEKADENDSDTGTGESLEESAEETGGEDEERKPDEEPEIEIQEVKEAAEDQNAEGSGENSVATSQQEKSDKSEDEIISRQREKIERAKIWMNIENAEDDLNTFVLKYNQYKAADQKISHKELEKAYKLAIDLAAGLEKLLLDAERGEKEDE